MSDNLTRNLLTNYYGFGEVKEGTRFLASHQGYSREFFDEKSGSDDPNGNFNNEKTHRESSMEKVNVEDFEDFEGPGELFQRSSRVVIDDDELDDGGVDINDEETNSESKVIRIIEQAPEENKLTNSALDFSEKTDARDEISELGFPHEIFPDSASDISLMSTKKKKKKKLRSITPAPSDPQPMILLPPTQKKNPIVNGEFCDMTNSSLTKLPTGFFDEISSVRMLYLENNELSELPDGIFTTLKSLQWLDVRNNRLKSIPVTIKHHQCLQTILLQGNLLEKLPLELCLVPKLKTLQTTGNPLNFPPPNVLIQGFASVMDFLRKEWNKNHPDQQIHHMKKIRSQSTILCDDPPSKDSSRSSKLRIGSSSSRFSNFPKKKTTREKSRNYKPSNRCKSSGGNSLLEEKIRWLVKIKEMLIEQSVVLQREKDRDSLEKWRKDRKNYDMSIKKAASRTEDDIPFGVDVGDMPFLKRQIRKKSTDSKVTRFDDIDAKMSEIFESLKQCQAMKQSNIQLNALQSEIQKIEKLYAEIQALKRQNMTSFSKYSGPNIPLTLNPYKPPPSIIL